MGVYTCLCVYKMHSATWLFPKTSEEGEREKKNKGGEKKERGERLWWKHEATLPSSGLQLLLQQLRGHGDAVKLKVEAGCDTTSGAATSLWRFEKRERC